MKKSIYDNRVFFLPYLMLLFVCTYFIVNYSKADIHIYLNQFHNPVADFFFKLLTLLGDGITLPFYLLIMAMFRFRYAILLVLTFLLSGLIVQMLKRSFFADIVRPAEFFKGVYDLYLVPGVEQNCCRSFPSGHTATAFSLMVCFAFVLKNNGLKFGVFLLACLIAYSRVYLSQHFLIDIVVGSIIGITSSLLLELLILIYKADWLDKNLLYFIKKR